MRISFLIVFIIVLSQGGVRSQVTFKYSTQKFSDSVAIGDTVLVGRHSIYAYNTLDCNCGFSIGGGTDWSNGWKVTQDGTYSANALFAPSQIGPSWTFFYLDYNCVGGRGCNNFTDVKAFDTAVGISDSFPKIRPLGWFLTMRIDSLFQQFSSHSAPTFDNPISDTTLYSDFTAKPTNGASIQLQVFDSLTPITQYVAVPFRRKHPLNLIFLSPNYQSFDTVIFSTRIRHSDVDSIISYALPVTWVAPASVAQGQSPGEDYALPNPFTTNTTIGFTLSKPEPVKLQLFDITGRTIRETERECATGLNEIELDTRDVPPGCYWYVVHGGEWERSGKLVKISQ